MLFSYLVMFSYLLSFSYLVLLVLFSIIFIFGAVNCMKVPLTRGKQVCIKDLDAYLRFVNFIENYLVAFRSYVHHTSSLFLNNLYCPVIRFYGKESCAISIVCTDVVLL